MIKGKKGNTQISNIRNEINDVIINSSGNKSIGDIKIMVRQYIWGIKKKVSNLNQEVDQQNHH